MNGADDDGRVSQGYLFVRDGWSHLRTLTPARIALGRVGASLPTRAVLALSLSHAQARDAVHRPLDVAGLSRAVATLGGPIIALRSCAASRFHYIARPDLGRRVLPDDLPLLPTEHSFDIVFVFSDGLSPLAVERHAVPVLSALWPLVPGLRKAPFIIATQARVALSDEVGARINAKIAVSLIGERPGLSSPASLGIYLTYGPKVGNTDETRNCISNVGDGGLAYQEAAEVLARHIGAALELRRTGVALPSAARVRAAEQLQGPSNGVNEPY